METALGWPQTRELPRDDFEYQPLPGPDYIRILNILPSPNLEHPIECGIETAPLDPSSKYAALSYSWGMNADGDDTLCRVLFINGKTKRITRNLFEGILRLRQHNAHSSPENTTDNVDETGDPFLLRLWIDAVCINQTDDEERADQVSRMGRVFESARRTVAWLGEGVTPDDDSILLQALKCANKLEGGHGADSHIWQSSDGYKHNICALGLGKDKQPVLTEFRRGLKCKICRTIAKQRYFTRRWVVQELCFSDKYTLRFYWGCYSCHWTQLLSVLRFSASPTNADPDDDIPSIHSPTQIFLTLSCIRIWQTSRSFTNFLRILDFCSHMRCSDPRDMLYSLAGLNTTFGISPDYTIDTSETYIRFARLLVKQDHIATLLMNSFSNVLYPSFSEMRLPSWVPDLQMLSMQLGFNPAVQSSSVLCASVNKDNVLTLSPYFIGTFESIIYDGIRDGRFSCCIRRAVREDGYYRPISRRDRKRAKSFQKGDIYCSLTSSLRITTRLCIFRPINAEKALFSVLGPFCLRDFFDPKDISRPLEQKTIHIV